MRSSASRATQAHFFGAATPGFNDGFRARTGDVLLIEPDVFGLPLRHRLGRAKASKPRVETL